MNWIVFARLMRLVKITSATLDKMIAMCYTIYRKEIGRRNKMTQKNKPRRRQLNIRLTEAQYLSIRLRAEEENKPVSTLVASLIEQEVQTEPTLRELAENQTDMSKKLDELMDYLSAEFKRLNGKLGHLDGKLK